MSPLWLFLVIPIAFCLGVVFQILNDKMDYEGTADERENWGSMSGPQADPYFKGMVPRMDNPPTPPDEMFIARFVERNKPFSETEIGN